MIKKRSLLLFTIVPLLLGVFIANNNLKNQKIATPPFNINTSSIPKADEIIISIKGDIYDLKNGSSSQITHGQNLIEPLKFNNSFIAVYKTVNYSSILQYDVN